MFDIKTRPFQPTPQIRNAKEKEAARLAQIILDWEQETPWFPVQYTKKSRCEPLALFIKSGSVYVSIRDTYITGFIILHNKEILGLYVDKKHRNKRIGTALLNHAKTLERHLVLWVFQNNTKACQFYQSHGFVKQGETKGKNEENIPDFEYAWRA